MHSHLGVDLLYLTDVLMLVSGLLYGDGSKPVGCGGEPRGL